MLINAKTLPLRLIATRAQCLVTYVKAQLMCILSHMAITKFSKNLKPFRKWLKVDKRNEILLD